MSNIEISGAKILVRFGGVVTTETVVNTWLIMLVIFIACRILTRGLTVRGGTKRQMVAEWIVTKVNGLVKTNMGEAFRDYPPLIAAIMALSALCGLSSMVGLDAPTSDLSTLVGWSLMVFVLITYYKIRANGFLGYLKGYTEPIVVMLPMNIVSEIATPISMAFRHFGNVASGTVVTALVYAALSALSRPPRLVVTDSQAFGVVSRLVPREVPLTSFSILFSRYKGYLEGAVRGVRALERLSDGAKVLISEGCTHHRQCGDIGTQKLPKWISDFTGKRLQFEFSSGTGFPEDLTPYGLIVHCGGCMLNEREMRYRAQCAADQGVPLTTAGSLVAHVHGILARSGEPLPDIRGRLD